MYNMRQQILKRMRALGGEEDSFYAKYSDYDILEDYESLVRADAANTFLTHNHDSYESQDHAN